MPFHFGVGRGDIVPEVAKRVDAIAEKHDCEFTHVRLPGEGLRYWFSAPNLGAPFDDATAKAVREDLAREGLDIYKLGEK